MLQGVNSFDVFDLDGVRVYLLGEIHSLGRPEPNGCDTGLDVSAFLQFLAQKHKSVVEVYLEASLMRAQRQFSPMVQFGERYRKCIETGQACLPNVHINSSDVRLMARGKGQSLDPLTRLSLILLEEPEKLNQPHNIVYAMWAMELDLPLPNTVFQMMETLFTASPETVQLQIQNTAYFKLASEMGLGDVNFIWRITLELVGVLPELRTKIRDYFTKQYFPPEVMSFPDHTQDLWYVLKYNTAVFWMDLFIIARMMNRLADVNVVYGGSNHTSNISRFFEQQYPGYRVGKHQYSAIKCIDITKI